MSLLLRVGGLRVGLRPCCGRSLIRTPHLARRAFSCIPRTLAHRAPTPATTTTVAAAIAASCSTAWYFSTTCSSAPSPPATTVAPESAAVDTPTSETEHTAEAEATADTACEIIVETAKNKDGIWAAVRYIWGLVDGGLLLLGCLFTIGGVAMGVLVPIRSAALLKAATNGALTTRAVLSVLAVANFQALLKMAGSACLLSVGDRLKQRLRGRTFAAVLAQELAWVHERRPAALIASITSDTEEVARAVSHVLGTSLAAIVSVLGSLVSLFTISPPLTALTLCLAPPVAVLGALGAARERRMRKVARAAGDNAVASASEVVEKLSTVQAYAQEQLEEKRYQALLAKEGGLNWHVLMFHKFWTTCLQLLTTSGTALALALAGSLAAAGKFDANMLLPFSQLAVGIGQGIGTIIFLTGDMAKLGDATRRLREVSERTPLIIGDAGEEGDINSPFLNGRMDLKGITFAYPSRPEQRVLNNCTLSLAPGKMTALVGPSGGGKSTLQLLLARFYDPAEGAVELDGADLKTLKPRWLRGSVVGVVTQEPVLLPGTIFDNIGTLPLQLCADLPGGGCAHSCCPAFESLCVCVTAYARPGATEEDVIAAATAANAHEFIVGLTDGYQTQLGGGGSGGLSVGQRQRLAIARALLKDPKVLLLDEPTSALDPAAEKAVQQALDRLSEGRTTLVVAHRLSTVRRADSIAVLYGGRIVEQGTHDELVKRDGVYAGMVRSQAAAMAGSV